MRILLLMLLVVGGPVAHAEMWKCTDQDGNISYTNVKSNARGCKALNLDPVITAPAPATRAQSKPANFPSVDRDTQKQRDAERRRILEREMAQEQQQLELAKKHLAEQKNIPDNEKNHARARERLKPLEAGVRLHESNLESLRKEIANIR